MISLIDSRCRPEGSSGARCKTTGARAEARAVGTTQPLAPEVPFGHLGHQINKINYSEIIGSLFFSGFGYLLVPITRNPMGNKLALNESKSRPRFISERLTPTPWSLPGTHGYLWSLCCSSELPFPKTLVSGAMP